MDNVNCNSERYVNSVNGNTAIDFPRKAPMQRHAPKLAQAAQTIGSKQTVPTCGSVLCARLGCCLCNDQPSMALGAMRPQDRPGARAESLPRDRVGAKMLRRSNS